MNADRAVDRGVWSANGRANTAWADVVRGLLVGTPRFPTLKCLDWNRRCFVVFIILQVLCRCDFVDYTFQSLSVSKTITNFNNNINIT